MTEADYEWWIRELSDRRQEREISPDGLATAAIVFWAVALGSVLTAFADNLSVYNGGVWAVTLTTMIAGALLIALANHRRDQWAARAIGAR
jgi:hypothetical protein